MKKLVVLVAAIAVGVAAKAENPYQCLYWQVDESQVASDIDSYNAAMFYKVGDAGNIELASVENAMDNRWSSSLQMTDFSGCGDGDSFVFELAKWGGSSWETVGTSEVFDYVQLVGYLAQWQAEVSTPPTQGGVFVPSFAAVPEPTTGLLMLLGFAGLALRRKRA